MTGRSTRIEIIARIDRIELVILSNDAISVWAVHCPDTFGQMTYYTQRDEATARDFYKRLVTLLSRRKEGI